MACNGVGGGHVTLHDVGVKMGGINNQRELQYEFGEKSTHGNRGKKC